MLHALIGAVMWHSLGEETFSAWKVLTVRSVDRFQEVGHDFRREKYCFGASQTYSYAPRATLARCHLGLPGYRGGRHLWKGYIIKQVFKVLSSSLRLRCWRRKEKRQKIIVSCGLLCIFVHCTVHFNCWMVPVGLLCTLGFYFYMFFLCGIWLGITQMQHHGVLLKSDFSLIAASLHLKASRRNISAKLTRI